MSSVVGRTVYLVGATFRGTPLERICRRFRVRPSNPALGSRRRVALERRGEPSSQETCADDRSIAVPPTKAVRRLNRTAAAQIDTSEETHLPRLAEVGGRDPEETDARAPHFRPSQLEGRLRRGRVEHLDPR